MNHNLKYPRLSEAQNADYATICYWYKELPSPQGGPEQLLQEQRVMEYIKQRYERGDDYVGSIVNKGR